jgi:hypothetical protein
MAAGPPDAVRHDPRVMVMASYLGTDERAIARSGAPTVTPTLATQETR